MSTAERYRALRSGYYRRVEIGAIAALGIHAAFFALAPPYVPRPFHLPPERPLRLVEEPAGAGSEAPREAPPPAAPVVRATPMLAAVESEQIEQVPGARARASGPQTSATGEGTGVAVRGGTGTGAYEEPPVFYSYETAPRAVRRVEPEYPVAARIAGAEGTVVINVNIDSNGRILRAWVAQTTAPESLVEAALDAVYQFEFLPGKQGAYPVKCTVAIPFHFSLKKTS